MYALTSPVSTSASSDARCARIVCACEPSGLTQRGVSFNVFASMVQIADSLPDAVGRAWGGDWATLLSAAALEEPVAIAMLPAAPRNEGVSLVPSVAVAMSKGRVPTVVKVTGEPLSLPRVTPEDESRKKPRELFPEAVRA